MYMYMYICICICICICLGLGGFQKSGYPDSWMVYFILFHFHIHLTMDDLEVPPACMEIYDAYQCSLAIEILWMVAKSRTTKRMVETWEKNHGMFTTIFNCRISHPPGPSQLYLKIIELDDGKWKPEPPSSLVKTRQFLAKIFPSNPLT